MSSFVGRDDDLVEIGRLLRTTRLVTLVGPAGVGKTRLAAELVGQLQRAGRGEVVLVELARTKGAAVALEIKSALGITHGDPHVLAGRDLLLVLDNCEHALDDCGELLGALLTQVPDLRVLATSRESLRLPGEVAYQVHGLSGADRRSDAVRLFLDRARTVAPELEFEDADTTVVAEICAKLDGLPLAIELAARLVRAFPLDEIRARLDDRLSLLTGGWRTADQRHQDLRKAIAWSYELLTPPEMTIFRRLSALPGGFGPDVAGVLMGETNRAQVLELLLSLEAKSLIMPCAGAPGTARFRMLESIRLFGQEELVASGEGDWTFDRIVDWLQVVVTPALEAVITSDEAMGRLILEHDNLEHVVERLSESADERQVLIAAALAQVRSHYGQVGDLTVAMLDGALDRTDPDSPHRSIALGQAAQLAGLRGQYDEAVRLGEAAVELERQRGRVTVLGRLLRLLHGVRDRRGEREQAMSALRETLDISRRVEDHTGMVLCLNDLAWHHLVEGDVARAERVLDPWAGVLRFARLPDRQVASVLHTRAAIALHKDDLRTAEARFAESLRVAAGACLETQVLYALDGLAVVALLCGRAERGLLLVGASDAAHKVAGVPRDPWSARRIDEALTASGVPEVHARATIATGRRTTVRDAVAYALEELTEDSGTDPLSQRERDVIELVTKGFTNRQIAARLYISVRTVETHLRKIRDTLGLRSRAHIAAWATQRGASQIA
ncbi:LuxR C-terminal-related transcriptional regulator [Lentzea sp. NBRC 105346]|uniref:ATP-binding protein n=1 Tax=Lentzea sp. NBRC 105346 TaxID=3032205 RepID=UPI002552797B|nr:LuxR C-terminal-related transcriptional regulator [Lentzea sp. NBRC 105346]